MYPIKIAVCITILLAGTMRKVEAQVYIPLNVRHAIQEGSRTMQGDPGMHYWQNSGDYVINIRFDPGSRLLTGNETVTYYNNSPDTLHEIVLQLFPDLYQKGISRWWDVDSSDENSGVILEPVTQDGKVLSGNQQGTNYIFRPASMLLPHSSANFQITWHYTVNAGSHTRTGQVDAGSFFLAYTFPHIAVYDDIDGWNMHSYNGLQEFYNDFGNFDVAITVPRDYAVWGTGTLMNPDEVFSKEVTENMKKVMQSDSVMFIIDQKMADAKKVTAHNDWNTFKFSAKHVTDFAFALSNHYIWQSSSLLADPATGRRVRIDAVYNPEHTSYTRVASVAHKSIAIMCSEFPAVPYPYPHETVFDGLDQMEYPMMVNDNPVHDEEEDIELTSHEIFHTYFPFYMGVNETKYAWMDEGWATTGEDIITAKILNDTMHKVFLTGLYQNIAGTEWDLPLLTLSTELNEDSYWSNSYGKPALTYLYVWGILGDSLFFRGLHYYMQEWNGKHPTPYDFFHCMNTGSGVNLDWFWKAWYQDPGYPDPAVMRVLDDGKNNYTVVLADLGNKPVPVDITVTFSDSTRRTFTKPASAWQFDNVQYVNFNSAVQPVKVVYNRLNIPDINPFNDIWIR